MSTSFVPGERARPAWLRAHPSAWLAAVLTVCFGAFMGQLDASIVTLTYADVGRSFHAGLGAVSWVSLGYLVSLASLLVVSGRISDGLGRKRVYLWGFAIFTLASGGCALAPSLAALIAARVVQGAGAAMLQANSVALVATSAPRAKLRTALGIQAAAQAIGLALGPTLGGEVVDSLGWRWVFALNIPVGLIALLAGRYLLPRTRDRTPRPRPGTPGVLLMALAMTLGLIGASELGSRAAVGAALLVLGTVAGLGLVRQQHRSGRPLADRELLATAGVCRGVLGAGCGYLLLFGPIVEVPIVLQAAGMTALRAGLVLVPLPLGFALAATLGDHVLPAGWSPGRRCGIGLATALAGLLALSVLGAGPLVPRCAGLGLVGLGLGLFMPASNTAVMAAVPASSAALAGGLINTARTVGTAAGVSVVTLCIRFDSSGRIALVVLAVVAATAIATVPRTATEQP